MKLAVVPVEGVFEDEHGKPETALENVYTDGEQFFIKDGHGKLTKEKVEAIARKSYNLAEERKSEHRLNPKFFDDLLFFQRQDRIRDMIATFKSVGIEVE